MTEDEYVRTQAIIRIRIANSCMRDAGPLDGVANRKLIAAIKATERVLQILMDEEKQERT